MFTKKLLRPRTLVAVGVVLVLMISAYAFAAANTVPVTGAGDGENPISGYTITAVDYTLGNPPTTIVGVNFNIVPDSVGASTAPEIQVQIDASGGWFACTIAAPPAAICDTSAGGGVNVTDADIFRVVAAQ